MAATFLIYFSIITVCWNIVAFSVAANNENLLMKNVVLVFCSVFAVFLSGFIFTWIVDNQKVREIAYNNSLYKKVKNYLFKHLIFSTLLFVAIIALYANNIISKDTPSVTILWGAYLVFGYLGVCIYIGCITIMHILCQYISYLYQYMQQCNIPEKIKLVVENLVSKMHKLPNFDNFSQPEELNPHSTKRKRNEINSKRRLEINEDVQKHNQTAGRKLEL